MRKCSDMPYHIGVVLKLYLSDEKKRLVAVNAGAQRSVYNHLVACNNEIYRLKKTAAYVPSDRERIDYLYSVSAKNRKERHTGVPTFHKKSAEQVWQTNCHYTSASTGLNDGTVRFLNQHTIMLPKLGKVRCDGSPDIITMLMAHNADTRIGTVTIRCDAACEYWARRFREDAEHAIMKQQRALSRKVEAAKREGRTLAASRNYQKQRIKLAKTHRLIARQRQDYLNVISKHMVENQDLIAAENLKVRNLLKNHCLAKTISDAGWRMLLTMLQQKAVMYGKTVILVPPQYTTQTCSHCGHILLGASMLPLSVREWTCPECGAYHLRDKNAAQNILNKALKILAQQS